MHKILQLIFTLTQWGGGFERICKKTETMMHSRLSKMTLSKNLGRDRIENAVGSFFVRFRPERASEEAGSWYFQFCLFSPPMWPESIHLGPLPASCMKTVQFWAFCTLAFIWQFSTPCIYIDMRHLMQTLNLFTMAKCSSDLKCLLFDTFVWIFSTNVDKSLILTKYQEQQKPFLLCFI